MKRITYLVGLLLILSSLFQITSSAAEVPNLTEDAKASILLERDTGNVLYEHNAEEQLPPASMTKIMTLLLVMEAIDTNRLSLDEKITISENASSMGGSQVFLDTGEVMVVDDLIKAIAIASGNDASVALAERLAGSEQAFVDQMNQKAKDLGLKNTHFQNASGLPAKNHYSTAHDMAVIAKELLKHEQITKYTSIYEDYLRKGEENEFWLVNTNKLIHFYPYVDGLKTGYTSEAKFCLTATAKKEDMRLIAVVMGADTVKQRNEMTMKLIDYGFNNYEVEKLFDKEQQVSELRNIKSEKVRYPVVTSEQISTLHRKGEKTAADLQSEVILHEHIDLSTKKGEEVGQMIIKDKQGVILESPLVLKEDLVPASFFTLWKRSIQYIVKND
jgi:D-alanyl-D-alanine carboxypeptidase (penicillin-binding protein 5/6)